jgi:hypothetical protein
MHNPDCRIMTDEYYLGMPDNLSLQVNGPLQIRNTAPNPTLSFGNGKELARITPDGIMQFTVEANDENALKFIECIEQVIARRLTGIEVQTPSTGV